MTQRVPRARRGSLTTYRRPYLRALSSAATLTVAQALLDIARPWPLKVAVDSGLQGRPLTGLLAALEGLSAPALALLAGAATVVLAVGAAVSGYAAEMLVGVAAARIGTDLRNALMARLLRLPLPFHDRHRSNELVSRLTTDVGRTEDTLVVWYESVVPGVLELAGMLLILLLVDPLLAGVALLVTPVLGLIAVRRRRLVRNTAAEARTAQGRLVARAGDLLRNVRVVQAFGQHATAGQEFASANQNATHAEISALRVEQRLAPVADLVLAVGGGLVLFVGVVRVVGGAVTLGTLLVVLSYVASLYGPVRGMTRLSGTLAKGAASRERLLELLHGEEPVADTGTREAPQLSEALTLRGVRFGYEPGAPVLDGVDLTLRRGETVCLMGRSGAGKSTLLGLVLRLYEPDAGALLLDGVDLREFTVGSLRKRLALVPQEPWLLDGTIRDNIAFGRPAVTDPEIRQAARAALVDDFVRTLPSGYETPVGEGGVRLSGGQRRRLAIARAIVRDTDVLLLDEPTSDLDATSASAVLAALRRASAGRTALLVTHDLAVAALADRVVVLDGGRILEEGRSTGPAPMTAAVTAVDTTGERG